MIQINLEGWCGTVSSLIDGTPTATGTKITLRGPLADAINKILKQKQNQIDDLEDEIKDINRELRELGRDYPI